MIDKEWLQRVTIAYEVYRQERGDNPAIEDFIKWLYQQYGIELRNKK